MATQSAAAPVRPLATFAELRADVLMVFSRRLLRCSHISARRIADELMVWISHTGPAGPAGSSVGTVSVGGVEWELFTGDVQVSLNTASCPTTD